MLQSYNYLLIYLSYFFILKDHVSTIYLWVERSYFGYFNNKICLYHQCDAILHHIVKNCLTIIPLSRMKKKYFMIKFLLSRPSLKYFFNKKYMAVVI